MSGLDWVVLWRDHFRPGVETLRCFGVLDFFFTWESVFASFFSKASFGSVSETHGSDVAGQSNGVTLQHKLRVLSWLLGFIFLLFFSEVNCASSDLLPVLLSVISPPLESQLHRPLCLASCF